MTGSEPLISIIIPVYQAKKFLDELVERIERTVRKITVNFEIILLEDSSTDNSWKSIEALAQERPFLKGIKLSRNFDQHYAITAGLDQAIGEWIVVMDCDLQDRPEEIKNLWETAQLGYDVVLARRISRMDGLFKRTGSKIFYRTLSYLTGSQQDETVANFDIYHQKVIQEIVKMRENIRYFPTMVIGKSGTHPAEKERNLGGIFTWLCIHFWNSDNWSADTPSSTGFFFYKAVTDIIPDGARVSGGKIPPYASNNAHMFYLVFELPKSRKAYIQKLKGLGIMAILHYLPLHQSPYYKKNHDGRILSNAEHYAQCLVRLPMYYDLGV